MLIDKYWSNSNLGYKKFNDHKIYEKDKGANFYMAKYIDNEKNTTYITLLTLHWVWASKNIARFSLVD